MAFKKETLEELVIKVNPSHNVRLLYETDSWTKIDHPDIQRRISSIIIKSVNKKTSKYSIIVWD